MPSKTTTILQRLSVAEQRSEDWEWAINRIADELELPSGAVRKNVISLVLNNALKTKRDHACASRFLGAAREIISGYASGKNMDQRAHEWLARVEIN